MAAADDIKQELVGGGETVRSQAIKQIQQKRRFSVELISSSIGMVLLLMIWAISEYNNAGGWPTHGFSQSSGIPNVWNFWIIYPLIGWGLIMGARSRSVFGNKPISESEIEQEIKRQRMVH
jgi:hypothetical protein